MKRYSAILLALSAVAVGAAPSLADMTIKLKDGRSITLPIQQDEIQSMTFDAATTGTPRQAPDANATAFESTPAAPASAPAAAAPPTSAALAPHMPVTHPSGHILHVGANRALRTPSQAAKEAKSGDTIEIDAGTYLGDVVTWTASNLTLRGVGNGRAHLEADGEAAQGKAIWVTAGNDIRIENIEFSGAKVGDGNGAGIRAEGAGLAIINCYFHDNQDGILAADNPDSDIDIENSAFVRNGTTSGQTHGVYINHVRTLVVRGSAFQDTITGHHLKTRAENDYIVYNRIEDLADGTGSYAVDLSNGGRAFIIGNLIQKGPRSENHTAIAFAMEGPSNPLQALYVVGNTIIQQAGSGMFVHSRSPGQTVMIDNILAGPGAPLDGAGKLLNNIIAEPNGRAPGNLNANGGGGNKVVRDAGFVDPATYDFHLRRNSPAVGAGVDPGMGDGFQLSPSYENAIPLGVTPRPATRPVDDGAFHFAR